MIRSGRINHTLFVCVSTPECTFICGLYGENIIKPSYPSTY